MFTQRNFRIFVVVALLTMVVFGLLNVDNIVNYQKPSAPCPNGWSRLETDVAVACVISKDGSREPVVVISEAPPMGPWLIHLWTSTPEGWEASEFAGGIFNNGE